MEKTTKLLGGWGYIALIVGSFLGRLSFIFHLVALAGIICLLIAFFRAGKELSQPKIQTNIIIAIVLYIVASLLLIFMVGSAIFSAVHGLSALTGGVIIGGLIAWILWIVGAWFWYQASIPLADGTGTNLYKTGGLLIFIGAITIIVFGLGFIVMLIGEIMQTVAFFTTAEKVPANSPA
ncbi:MAG TPA: DUF996 domain-containing protein [Gammaproteobacteria bacterium]|nr:DUF996 domain-containing protein [Gammaproteobacteria bacterium]